MELKTWLLSIRIMNILCSALMLGFQIWYIIALIHQDKNFFITTIRMFTPIFVILLAVTILTAQFKYSKVVEHFKFLQFVPGIALFQFFIASLMAFQFSTTNNDVAPIVTSVLFICLAFGMGIMHCLKPAGTESLLAAQD